MSHSLINQSQLIANIDRLVRDVIFSPVNFDDIKNRLNVLYSPFMETLNPDLFYSQTIDSFVFSTDAIVGDLYPSDVIWDHKKTQQFINTITCYKRNIENEDNAWCYQESQNKRNLESYVRNLLNHYSRLLFIRVDLMYSKETRQMVTIEDFNRHMTKLREFIGNKKTCFEHLQGNAWALEHGYESGGLHCHLLLIYDGSERNSDYYLAKEVGEKWRSITADTGTYYNYHYAENKQRYDNNDKLGIGMIHRDNSKQVENAVYSALYLTKPEKVGQHLKVWLPGMRTFGHGTYRTRNRRGLPPITN